MDLQTLLTILLIEFVKIVILLIILYHILIKPIEKQLNRMETKLSKLLGEKEGMKDDQE